MLPLLFASLALLGACATPAPIAPDIGRHIWAATQFDGAPVQSRNLPTLLIAGERASGSSGCNRFFATVTRGGGDRIQFSQMGMTRMACAPERMALEHSYANALQRAVIVREEAPNTLVLRDASNAVVLTFGVAMSTSP